MNNKATVITGQQGAGKNIRARALAAGIGSFKEISWAQLREPFGLASLTDATNVVIVDEVPPSEAAMQSIKALITSPTIRINRKHREPLNIPSPHFIFLTGAESPVETGRLYTVIRL